MKVTKDLTPQLVNAEKKDKFYAVHGTISRLLAPQHYKRPFSYQKKGWGEIERVETTTDGTPDDKRSPKRKSRIRKGESEVKTGDCWTFRTVHDGIFKSAKDTIVHAVKDLAKKDREETTEKTDKNEEEILDGDILLPWGSHFGIFKKALLRSLEAQKRLKYDAAPLALIKVYPLWLNVGKAPCDSMKEGKVPEVILETRHTQGGDVMVEVFFDYLENREFTCYLEVDSEAPINEERLVGLLKTLNTLDNVGASKRGSLKIGKIEQVELTEDDLKKMEAGEPVMPVVY
jgi:hypothetical protein